MKRPCQKAGGKGNRRTAGLLWTFLLMASLAVGVAVVYVAASIVEGSASLHLTRTVT